MVYIPFLLSPKAFPLDSYIVLFIPAANNGFTPDFVTVVQLSFIIHVNGST